MSFRFLRIFLIASSCTWLVSLAGVFLPWASIEPILKDLGASDLRYVPMLEYWFRMTAGAFSGIGILFLALAIFPEKLKPLVPFAGIFMVLEGIVLFSYGLKLGLLRFPFYSDTSACILLGAGILVANYKVDWNDLEPQTKLQNEPISKTKYF